MVTYKQKEEVPQEVADYFGTSTWYVRIRNNNSVHLDICIMHKDVIYDEMIEG